MFCPNCGAQINPQAEICVNCGVNVRTYGKSSAYDDQPNGWVNFLSLCCIPILGIILYFVWKDTKPRSAKSALTFSLIGIGISVIVWVIFFFFGMIAGYDDSYYY